MTETANEGGLCAQTYAWGRLVQRAVDDRERVAQLGAEAVHHG
jgi:hypothetical protein